MKTALITGGSSGIGYEMSRYFAREGYQLLWASLDEAELAQAKSTLEQEVANVSIHTLAVNLSDEQGAQQIWDWAKRNEWQVDVLINNAGFGLYGFVNEKEIEREVAMIKCNALSLYVLTRLFLREMVERDEGTIINISSNSSFQPVPRMCTYASTKAFVKHFSRGLTEELKLMKSQVRILTVCPSAISDTPFRNHEGMDKVKTFNGLAYTTTEEVARDVWKGFTRGKNFVVSGWKMRLLYKINFLVPYRVIQFITQKETELSS
ncbi:MAG: SDR family NAD(P)-dependent oxidoreductase [Bacteroidota bacterium]